MGENQGAKANRVGLENEENFIRFIEEKYKDIKFIKNLKEVKKNLPFLIDGTGLVLPKNFKELNTALKDGNYFLSIKNGNTNKKISWKYTIKDIKTGLIYNKKVIFDVAFVIVKDNKITSLTFGELKTCNVEGSDTEKLMYKPSFIIDEKVPVKFFLFVVGKLSNVGKSKYIEIIRLRNLKRFSNFLFIVAHEIEKDPEILYRYITEL